MNGSLLAVLTNGSDVLPATTQYAPDPGTFASELGHAVALEALVQNRSKTDSTGQQDNADGAVVISGAADISGAIDDTDAGYETSAVQLFVGAESLFSYPPGQAELAELALSESATGAESAEVSAAIAEDVVQQLVGPGGVPEVDAATTTSSADVALAALGASAESRLADLEIPMVTDEVDANGDAPAVAEPDSPVPDHEAASATSTVGPAVVENPVLSAAASLTSQPRNAETGASAVGTETSNVTSIASPDTQQTDADVSGEGAGTESELPETQVAVRVTDPQDSPESTSQSARPSVATTGGVVRPLEGTNMQASIERILSTIDVLAKQPPPRVLTLDLTELHGVRVTLSLDSGMVSVQVADSGAGDAFTKQWQEQLNQMLGERGLGSGDSPEDLDESADGAGVTDPAVTTSAASTSSTNELRI